MSTATLVTLTVLEIVALVAVLAVYLILVSNGLRRIAATLGQVTFGVRAVEQQVSAIAPGLQRLNGVLQDVARTLPTVASKAESLAAQR
ncbi:MAG: hypothetical protein M3276_09435 [Actinomycetota bacterium]|nr:hypothetical protein [Actinomycetota bacterium]